MKRITLIIYLLLLIACEQEQVKKETGALTEPENDSEKYIPVLEDTSKQENIEYIDWDSLKINGAIPLHCRQKDLYKLLGQPDSIVNPDLNDICVSYYEGNFKYAYFGESNFEIHGDSAVISTVDFNKVELVDGNKKLILNNSVTIESFEKLFPVATKRKQKVSVYNLGETTCIKIATGKRLTDDAWLLFFVDGKLKRLNYWMPC